MAVCFLSIFLDKFEVLPFVNWWAVSAEMANSLSYNCRHGGIFILGNENLVKILELLIK